MPTMMASALARRLPAAAAASAARAAAAAAAAAAASASSPPPASPAAGPVRSLAGMRSKDGDTFHEAIPEKYTLESVKPPPHWNRPDPAEPDPNAYARRAVTSAHAVDSGSDPPRLSARDSAALSPTGAVVHGRYGELESESTAGVPLEYLALLRHAAEGAAAVRTVSESAGAHPMPGAERGGGTVLVYGASQPQGLAAAQLASTSGLAVVAVVGGEHSGNDGMMDIAKHLASEPGTAVPEEYAMVKAKFRDVVEAVSVKADPSEWPGHDAGAFLADFKENLLAYVEAYPDTLPAAVSAEHLEFTGKEKDRKNFRANMETYLSQFPPGEAPIDPTELDARFDEGQYAAWKAKFQIQTTDVVSGGGDYEFSPSKLVRGMMAKNEDVDEQILESVRVSEGAGDYVPYEFSVLDKRVGEGSAVDLPAGGPVLGAVVVATPNLRAAAGAVAAAETLRGKAEALQFLPDSQRHAFAAARAVVNEAKRAGRTAVVVGGSLPGLDTVEATDADVKEALSAMDVDEDEDGQARLNYFLQVYRAGDWPVYADYAIHRATEELAGPRQIVVTK